MLKAVSVRKVNVLSPTASRAHFEPSQSRTQIGKRVFCLHARTLRVQVRRAIDQDTH
jgi:hypothetical protein